MSTTIYAAPYDTVEGFPFVADAWYFQRENQWMAVVREWEPEADWFEDDCYALDAGDTPNWPTPRTYPIHERPPREHRLVYRLEDGTEVVESYGCVSVAKS
jgi:hypothetical protein